MTKFIDVTVPLSAELPTFPGDPPFQVDVTHRIGNGDSYNVARMTLGTHAGTHVDAPFHFIPDGSTIDELELEILIGKVRAAARL